MSACAFASSDSKDADGQYTVKHFWVCPVCKHWQPISPGAADGSAAAIPPRSEVLGPLQSNQCCDIRRKLAEEFSVHARLFSEAVVQLTSYTVLAPERYAKLREAVEKAQTRAEQASVQFEEHVERHRCGLTDYQAKLAAPSA